MLITTSTAQGTKAGYYVNYRQMKAYNADNTTAAWRKANGFKNTSAVEVERLYRHLNNL